MRHVYHAQRRFKAWFQAIRRALPVSVAWAAHRLQALSPLWPLGLGTLLGLGLGVSALLGLGSVLSLSLGTLGLSLVYWWAWNAEPVWLTEALLPPPPPEPPLVEPLDMVALPDGTFLMGAPETDRLAFSDEKPAHAVTVTAFCISRFLITRQFYRDIIGQEPEAWADDTDDGRLPANHLTWFEAIAFCNALSVRVGLHPCYEVMDQHVAWDTQADG